MERATVYRWNIRNGTGVLTRTDGSLAWFHLSTVDKGDVSRSVKAIRSMPKSRMFLRGYECRAVSVRRHVK